MPCLQIRVTFRVRASRNQFGWRRNNSVHSSPFAPIITACVCAHTCLVVSDSVAPWTVVCGPFCPWNFPGKNTGESCHLLLQGGLPNLGIEPASLAPPALAGRFFTTAPPGKSYPWQEFNLALHILKTSI